MEGGVGVEGKVKEKVDTSKAGVGIALPRKKKKHQQVQGRRGCGSPVHPQNKRKG